MKITKRQLKRIIKEEKTKILSEAPMDMERINAEQARLQAQSSVTHLLGELHNIIDQLIQTVGNEEAYLELSGIVEDWEHN